MADVKQTDTMQGFVVSVGQTLITTEEQALSVYYQMQSYPELQKLLSLHASEITKAIQSKDTGALINIIQKVQSDFLRTTAELPEQIQQDTEKKLIDAQLPPDKITKRVDSAKEALGETYKTAETLYSTKRKQNQEFIEKLVKNYTKLSPADASALTETIIKTAETYPELPPKEVIQSATKSIPQLPERVAQELQKHQDLATHITTAKKNDVTIIEQQIIQAVLDSPEPAIVIRAVQTYGETKSSIEIPKFIQNAQILASASSETQLIQKDTQLDYSGFFSTISKNGTVVEKTLAPLADTVFSFFPQKTQEAVVLKVLGSSWNKEVSNNTFLQKTVGPLFQTQPVQQAITKGTALFQSGGKNAVFTKTQTFFADIFVTIFHPQVSEVYLQLAGMGNTQMGTSVSSYYAGWLASQGATAAAKKGAKVVGGKIAAKAAGTTFGKVIGGLLGSEGGPVGAFIGSLIFDKLLGGILSGVKKGFNFITLDWFGKLITGNYESTPISKDPTFIISAVIVCAVALLFVIPLTPITLVGNSFFQQLTQDNAYIGGMGGVIPTGKPGINTGAGFSCSWSGPVPPKTSISSCPVRAPITQGPNTSTGSHIGVDAYDFGCADGTPIHAAHDGYVVSLVTTYAPNEYKYGSFGNNVVLVGMDGSNQNFCTNYAHLLDVTPAVISAYQNKSLIHAGEVIGYSDTTGYTYGSKGLGKGPHLHFGYKGSGKLSLPPSCP